MSEYIIVGDTEIHGTCLIYICGKSLESAETDLYQMLNNPTDIDKERMKGHTNIRIKEVPEEDCWWHGKLD